jgi:hypothetical protein
VRDRDRLRQARLQELGWRIERIWSTDWFADSRREIGRMLATIESILQARSEIRPAETSLAEQSPQVEAQTPAGETEGPASDFAGGSMHLISPQEARERLIELRETEMARSFPNVLESANLLRPEILDILLRARPTDLESFHRVVPLRLREETDPGQFRRYLPEVLDVLAAVAPRATPELRLAATSAPTSSRKAMRAPPP